MSEKRVKVEREVSEREIKVEREQILKPELIVTGVFPDGTKQITENGEYDVELFKKVNVAVPTVEEYILGTLSTTDAKSLIKEFPPIELGSEVTSLTEVFANFRGLEKLDLSNWDTSQITDFSRAFYGCSSMKYLNISGWTDESASHGADYIFNNCSALETVVIDSPTMFKVRLNPFYGAKSDALFFVPDELVNDYKTNSRWSERADYIKPLSELPANAGA